MSGDRTSIGKYQIERALPSGASADVFVARLEGIAGFRRTFLIKHVHAGFAADEERAAALEDAARLAAVLSHGNIVQLLDLGREDGRPYLVMEWVDGWTLGQVLDAHEGPIPRVHALAIGLYALKAVAYAHHREILRDGQSVELGLVHGDLGPWSLHLSRGGEVKVGDYGLAALSADQDDDAATAVARRRWQAPEVRDGAEPTPASDVYQTGWLLRALLCDDDGPALGAPDAATAAGDPPLPEALATLIDQAIDTDPAKRPEGVGPLVRAVEDALAALQDVYSQEDLASFLRALFGEPEPVVADEEPEGPDTDVGDPLDDDDDLLPDLPEKPDDTQPAPDHDGPTSDDDDARTVVGGLTPMQPRAEDWNDAGATTVDPEMARRLAGLRVRTAPGPRTGGASVAPVVDEDPKTRIRRHVEADPEVAAAVAAAPAGGTWLGGALSAAVMLLVGLVLGFALAATWGRASGMTVRSPLLDVRTAPDVPMQVFVDGDRVQGPTELSPGTHAVKVDVAGGEPWKVDLALEAGEYRLMMVEAHRIAVPDDALPAADAAE